MPVSVKKYIYIHIYIYIHRPLALGTGACVWYPGAGPGSAGLARLGWDRLDWRMVPRPISEIYFRDLFRHRKWVWHNPVTGGWDSHFLL